MTRCNHQGCTWTSDDALLDEQGQPVPPVEQLRAHADEQDHPLCLLCRRSLRPGEPRVCEKTLSGLQRTLHDLVDLAAVLPVELGHVRAIRYDTGGGKGAREHALPGGAVLTLLAPGGAGGVARRLTPAEQHAATAELRRAIAELHEHQTAGEPHPLPDEPASTYQRRLIEHHERTRLLRVRARLAEQAAQGREHAADQLETDGISLAQVLAEFEDEWRRARAEPAADRAATITGAAGYLERHMRWASVSLDAETFVDFARQLRDLLHHARATAGLSERPARAGTTCLQCGGELVQQYSAPARCNHGSRPAFPVERPMFSLACRRQLHDLLVDRWERAHAACTQGGRAEEWSCSRCQQRYTPAQHRQAVAETLVRDQERRLSVAP